MSDVLSRIEGNYPGFLEGALDIVSEAAVYEVLKAVADTPAPSQTASMTRGRVMNEILEERGVLRNGITYTRDAFGTGSDLLERGTGGVRLVAHMDEISYVVAGGEKQNRSWPLIAFCYHLADGPRRARVIRYSPKSGYYVAARGEVRDRGGLHFVLKDGDGLEPGDRVVLDYPVEIEEFGGRVTGHLDNAAGVACAMLAAEALAPTDIPFSVVFTDEEEGPAGESSQTISRGAARVYRHLEPSALDVVIDVHGLGDSELHDTDFHRLSWGASFAEFSSRARGSVAPPHIYATLTAVAESLGSLDVSVRPNLNGYVSRSDDVVAMMHTPCVALLGYPGMNRHFDEGLATSNITDLRDLGIALATIVAAFSVVGAGE